MKKRALAALSISLFLTSGAWCALIQFEGLSATENIPISGWADISVQNIGTDGSQDALIIEIMNTSPVQTALLIANPLLTGFGLRLPDSALGKDDIQSWTAVLGSDSTDVSSQYNLTKGTGIGSGLNDFTMGTTGVGNDGRIGNIAATGQFFGIPAADVIFDSVVFTFFFEDGALTGLDPAFFGEKEDPNMALRFQSIGLNAADSGAAVPDGDPVPEPTTILLVGSAIAFMAGASKRRRT